MDLHKENQFSVLTHDDVDQTNYTNTLNANTKNSSISHINTKYPNAQSVLSSPTTNDKKEALNASQLPFTLKDTTKLTKGKNISLPKANSSGTSIPNTFVVNTAYTLIQQIPLSNSSTSSYAPQEELLRERTFFN